MDFISLENDVAGLVQSYESKSENGEDILTFTGVELKGLTARRIVFPADGKAYLHYANKSPEYIINALISNSLVAPSDSSRKVYGSIAPYQESATRITYDGRYQNLEEEIETLATTYNIGWCASIENGAIVWKIWHGVDRTAGQSKNNRMILDYEYGTMNNSSLNVENLVPNYMIIAGRGEGENRETATIDKEKSNIERIETFVDARDIEDNSLLTQRGEQKLSEYGDNTNYTATLSNQAVHQYRIDYELGDIGTIRDKSLHTHIDYRITQLEEVYEDNQFYLNLTFGYDKKTLKDAVKRMTNKQNSLFAAEGIPNIPLATGTTEGLVSTTEQTLGGKKIFENGIEVKTSFDYSAIQNDNTEGNKYVWFGEGGTPTRNSGLSYNPANNILNVGSISGTASKLTTARDITIGKKTNTFDGSSNVSWTLAEMGVSPRVKQGGFTLSANGWTQDTAPYRQEVDCDFVKSGEVVIFRPGMGYTAEKMNAFTQAQIQIYSISNGKVYFWAYGTKPTTDLRIAITDFGTSA